MDKKIIAAIIAEYKNKLASEQIEGITINNQKATKEDLQALYARSYTLKSINFNKDNTINIITNKFI